MAEENERSDIKLEGDVAVWEMKVDGSIKGTYMGVFRFRCYLTPLQQIAAGREERELLGPNLALATEHERFLAYALCQLKYRIISAPPFWASANPSGSLAGDLADEEIVASILDAATHAELKYKKQLMKRKDSAVDRAKEMNDAIIEKQKEDSEIEDEDEA